MKKLVPILIALVLFGYKSAAQVLTAEDSLNAGLVANNASTVISGYGQAKTDYNLRYGTGTASLTRNVIFIGHKFNDKIGFFSEMEMENAVVAPGDKISGEISMEQLFLKFNVSRSAYLVTGLFIPRIGIINENHLPNTFNGNDRHYVEQLIIPSTWRELGIGVYGQIRSIGGLNYSLSLSNGLDASGFSHNEGIRGGRQEGKLATSSNIALTGSLLYYYRNFRVQASGYYGGSCGLSKREADSLKLNYGAFGTPVALAEANVQYHSNGLSVKALAVVVSIKDAYQINRAYSSNISGKMIGYFIEAGYNILFPFNPETKKNLTVFTRYEVANMNASLPSNAEKDDFMKKSFWVSGITWQPIRNVAIKADYVQMTTGNYNPALYNTNPYATTLPFYKTNSHLNLGIAYSF